MKTFNHQKYNRFLLSSPKILGVSVYDLMAVSLSALGLTRLIGDSVPEYKSYIVICFCSAVYYLLYLKNTYLPKGVFVNIAYEVLLGRIETIRIPAKKGEETDVK